jgi:hypothetical protein
VKSVTEFWSFALLPGMETKKALVAEGKTPEEISAAMGEKHKMEGDKLKHFINAIEVAAANLEKLSRVLVVSLGEGENPPPKSTKIEEHHYIPDFKVDPKPVMNKKSMDERNGPKKGGKGKGGGPKESPWGLSPEQKAAKKGKQAANKPS